MPFVDHSRPLVVFTHASLLQAHSFLKPFVVSPAASSAPHPRKTTADRSKKRARLITQWRRQQAEARRLDEAIEKNLARLGFGARLDRESIDSDTAG